NAEELLAKYAWYGASALSKSHSAGVLKPNDLGLFDMHGNVFEWTHDAPKHVAKGQSKELIDDVEDEEDMIEIKSQRHRIMRGGCFLSLAIVVASAYRESSPAGFFDATFGFRVARTIPVQLSPEPALGEGR